tara:strand:- start:45 stop:350 length:306 start_codon:yes stop_codon:yes gene_type:complete
MPQGKGTYGSKKGRPPKKMMGGGSAGVKMPKMMSRGGKVVQAERKAMGVGSVGKEVMKKLGLAGAGAGAATKAIAKGAKSLLKGKPTFTRAQLKSLTKKKK